MFKVRDRTLLNILLTNFLISNNSGIIEVSGRRFTIKDIEKFLYLWATFRNLEKDIIYKTSVTKGIHQIEGEMPPEVIFGGFSAYCKKYQEAPADYDKIYVYIEKENLDKTKSRFPFGKGYINLVVVGADTWLKNFGKLTPDCQTFVDFWNMSEWYAKDFLNSLVEEKNFRKIK